MAAGAAEEGWRYFICAGTMLSVKKCRLTPKGQPPLQLLRRIRFIRGRPSVKPAPDEPRVGFRPEQRPPIRCWTDATPVLLE